ncbi:hypothetical protein H4R35_003693 [Dimargaris xerosporica]|nr:hypothetical protein H4R35_003693 [Dimargaris xerosporica]
MPNHTEQDNREPRRPLQHSPPTAAADSQYVPSFASFPDLPIDATSSSPTQRQKKRRKSGDREHRRPKKPREPRRPSRDRQARALKPSALRRTAAAFIRPNDAFYLDVRGDAENLTLQSLHTADIPAYRRDQNQVIGLPSSQRILRGHRPTTRNLGVEIVDSRSALVHLSLTNASRYATLAAWQRVLASSPEPIGTTDGPSASLPSLEEATADVIPVPSSPLARSALEPPSHEELHTHDKVDYRSIHGMLKPSASQANNGSTLSAQDRNIRLIHDQIGSVERTLKQYPANVAMWRQLLALQSQLAIAHDPGASAALGGVSQRPSVKFKRALAEIHIAVYERALSHVTNDPTLALEYLATCEDVLEFDVLVQKWSRVLKTYHQSAELQLAYLNFRQTHTNGFTCLDDILKLYHQGQQRLAVMRSTGPANGDAEMEGWQMYLFIRACMFLKEAGYIELAWAAYQAQLELTFNGAHPRCLPDLNGPAWEATLAGIAQWWISEGPRPGDRGWLPLAGRDQPATAPASIEPWMASVPSEALSESDLPLPDGTDRATPCVRWYQSERLADIQQLQPTKTRNLTPSKPLVDPFSVPLPDEFTPLLFAAHHVDHRHTLLYLWAFILNLPFRPPGWTSRHPWQADPFLGLTGSIDTITLAKWSGHHRELHPDLIHDLTTLPDHSPSESATIPVTPCALSAAVRAYSEFWGKLSKPRSAATAEHHTHAQFDHLPFCFDNLSQPLMPLGLAYVPPHPLADLTPQPLQGSDRAQPLIRPNFGHHWLGTVKPRRETATTSSSSLFQLTSQLADCSPSGQGVLLLTLLRCLEDQLSASQVLRASKQLLKLNDTRLELWLHHARLEAQQHRTDACRKLYATVAAAWRSEPDSDFTRLASHLLVIQEWCEWELGLPTATVHSQLVITLGANPALAATCTSYIMDTNVPKAETHASSSWESLVHTTASATRGFYQQCLQRCADMLHVHWKPPQDVTPTPLGPGLPLTRAMTGYVTVLSLWSWWLWGAQRFADARQLFTGTLAYIEENVSITTDLDLSSTLSTLPTGVAGTLLHEQLYTAYLTLLLHAMHFPPFQPKHFRDALTKALRYFPLNTWFLQLFFVHERRHQIDGRLRQLLYDGLSQGTHLFVSEASNRNTTHPMTASPLLLTFALYTELHTLSSEPNGAIIRTWFEQALDAPCRSSPEVWLLYLTFERKVAVKTTQHPSASSHRQWQRVKAIFYRAMCHCPWSKRLALLPFGPLADAFSGVERQQLYLGLLQRQIRLHTDWEGGDKDKAIVE